MKNNSPKVQKKYAENLDDDMCNINNNKQNLGNTSEGSNVCFNYINIEYQDSPIIFGSIS